MTQADEQIRTALVLPGGGARGAFQVGVLKAIAELLPRDSRIPFRFSAGHRPGRSIRWCLPRGRERLRSAVAELEHVWGNFHCHHVYRTDHLTMLKSSLHWLASIVLGGWLVGTPKSLLDNAPLRELLSRNVRFPRIQDAIEAGDLEALAVTAAGYSSARSTTFFEAHASMRAGSARADSVNVRICTWITSWPVSPCR